MESVQSWVFTICAGTLICGVASALVPSKSYEKTVRLLLGLFMLFCFLMPVTLDWEFPQVDLQAAENRRMEVAGQTGSQAEQQLYSDFTVRAEAECGSLLRQYELEPQDYRVEAESGGDGSLTLRLTLPESARQHSEAIRSALTAALGTEVSLDYFEQTGEDG